MLPLQFKQARKYSRLGLGLGGALLKHSLYPLEYLATLLEGAETVFDLGCGEGMLTNLLAAARPEIAFHAWDLDRDKIGLAQKAAAPTAHFEAGDFRHLQAASAGALIFNDVLHHYPFDQQAEILDWCKSLLAGDGLIILKEVDASDKHDVAWTTYWDNRLYPADKLHFRTIPEWKTALSKAGFRLHDVRKVRHPWPASRTVLVASRAPKFSVSHPAPAPADGGAEPWRILVTGGSGFIGEHLLRALAAGGLGGRPVAIDAIARNPANFPPDLRTAANVRVIHSDLSKKDNLGELPTAYDYIFHLAADVDFFAGESIIRNNLEATRNLLDHVSKGKLRRFVYTSTMGAVDRARDDRAAELLTETSPAHPVSPYGQSKLDGERLVEQSGCPWTILRVPWCYGPGMSRTHHVRVLFEKVMRRGFLFRFDWPGRVSIVAVDDLVRLLTETAMSDAAGGRLYFVSDKSPISFGELFREMGATVGLRAGFQPLPRLFSLPLRAFHRFLPFQVKCLLFDSLAVSPARLIGEGHVPADREDGFLIPLARYISQQTSPLRHRETALITGAAGGIGAALARQAYAVGYSLWLVDRNEAALQAIASKLSATGTAGDLSDASFLARLEERIANNGVLPRIVINNAGIGRRGAFAGADVREELRMVDVNVAALVRLTHACLAAALPRRALTVFEISSSSAFQPLAGMAVYAATKAFVLLFSEALAAELSDLPAVEVITIIPSGTRTAFQQEAGVKNEKPGALLDPNDVAGEILRCIGRGSRTHIIGRTGKMMNLLSRILPRRCQAPLWKHLMNRMR